MQIGIEVFLIDLGVSIRSAIGRMDQNKFGALLVVDQTRRLLGVVTDGDVRHAILADMDLEGSVGGIMRMVMNCVCGIRSIIC